MSEKQSWMPFSQTFLVAFFSASLIAANLLGSKLVDLFGITVSLGIFVFPLTFISLDIMTEIYGKSAARKTVFAGLIVQLYVLLFVYLGKVLPASPVRDVGEAYNTMFALAPRMVLASITAYAVSQLCDVHIFSKLKQNSPNMPLVIRTNVAAWTSQLIDTAIFYAIFLGGVLEPAQLFKTFLFGYAAKMVVATFDSPLVNLGVWAIKRWDHPSDQQNRN